MRLFQVVGNLVVDRRRGDRAAPDGLTKADFADFALEYADSHTDLIEDRSVTFFTALGVLPPAHRRPVARMHVMSGTGTYAGELGVPKRGIVTFRTHQGVRALRTVLARRGVDAVAA